MQEQTLEKQTKPINISNFNWDKSLETKPQSQFMLTLNQMRRNRLALVCMAFLLLVFLATIFAPIIAPYDPTEMHTAESLTPPNAKYLFGTDDGGRDILSRVLWGGRISLRVGLISTVIAVSIGLILGLVSGYYGGAIGFIILRLMDLMLAFPGILLALIVVAILGPGIDQAMIAVGIGEIPTFVRVVNSAVVSCKENEYVTGAITVGCRDNRILLRYILPNIMAPIIVMATLFVAGGIFSASSLSFLGLGAQPPSAEWGAMISRGRNTLRLAPWMSTFPGLSIALVVIAINIVGDSLRDALDPWIRAR
jgi:peptide/nickel transport system permease protein